MKCAVRLERLVEGSPANQLAMQNAQRMAVIDVIPRRKHVHFEPELAGALDALGGDTACAPFDILEHAPMRTFEAEQVVTAVNGRSQHRSLARLRQDIDGFDDKRGGQRRTVGIEHDCATMPTLEELHHGRQQTIAKRGKPGLEGLDLKGQNLPEKCFAPGGTKGHVSGNRSALRGLQKVLGNILEERGIECCGLPVIERRHEPGLGTAGNRGFSHDGNTARCNLWVADRSGAATIDSRGHSPVIVHEASPVVICPASPRHNRRLHATQHPFPQQATQFTAKASIVLQLLTNS